MSDMNETINGLLRGSFDLHVHAFPDGTIFNLPRRMNAFQTVEEAHKAGMAGLVLKAHEFLTAPLVSTLAPQFPDMQLVGAIVLNKTVGRLIPEVVEAAVRLGARMVWMPTFHAHLYSMERLKQPGISILDQTGRLLPAVMAILQVIQGHGAVLNTGHISPEEIRVLVPEALHRNIKTVITHGTFRVPLEDMRSLAQKGAFVEHAFHATLGNGRFPEMADIIKAVGIPQSIISSDFGGAYDPPPVEGMRMFIASLLRLGFQDREIERMGKVNPKGLFS